MALSLARIGAKHASMKPRPFSTLQQCATSPPLPSRMFDSDPEDDLIASLLAALAPPTLSPSPLPPLPSPDGAAFPPPPHAPDLASTNHSLFLLALPQLPTSLANSPSLPETLTTVQSLVTHLTQSHHDLDLQRDISSRDRSDLRGARTRAERAERERDAALRAAQESDLALARAQREVRSAHSALRSEGAERARRDAELREVRVRAEREMREVEALLRVEEGRRVRVEEEARAGRERAVREVRELEELVRVERARVLKLERERRMRVGRCAGCGRLRRDGEAGWGTGCGDCFEAVRTRVPLPPSPQRSRTSGRRRVSCPAEGCNDAWSESDSFSELEHLKEPIGGESVLSEEDTLRDVSLSLPESPEPRILDALSMVRSPLPADSETDTVTDSDSDSDSDSDDSTAGGSSLPSPPVEPDQPNVKVVSSLFARIRAKESTTSLNSL
ncbi:hypothetical protein BDK51DRAFT_44433 [Blyttiomyces helicus]|uniref:Uncharacterized protein n=1 Tax=Blyttiomyces helicus TaxID=388810 RepID=A0A4P9W1Y3_9FUNG|nr:hypothetical protein BDK51DRAFT_44433 [Blyttiomyces helicus]|eukprot:RKO86209.1 hypothetical protein BDK51DRAFT_44433 [Blyttiomyces helicus]